ncbi:hypothetical protein M7I_1538 [Glarea lozoyensis 74030]|uniref:Uncharacterized protein n=1 Tax=Glarea lozoyensis (strain ATCC 74030 / MF5533) TaxID=1104152 RepID=H0EGC3_GLAL7|nr:hypothetical protein M7I_1538 [Glarea lozoyensis 74030]
MPNRLWARVYKVEPFYHWALATRWHPLVERLRHFGITSTKKSVARFNKDCA